MKVLRFSRLDELERLASDWDRLSRGVPFRGWTWMSHWWRHYGPGSNGRRNLVLYVLVVMDGSGVPVGIAPWYRQTMRSRGRVVRFLGSEEVCGDYLGLLCEPTMEAPVAAAVADWLCAAAGPRPRSFQKGHPDAWDLLELVGVDAQDTAVGRLVQALQSRGNRVHQRDGPSCWRIALPDSWPEYLALLSKSHRKQLRRMERNLLDSGRVALRQVDRQEDLAEAARLLIQLHQKRRASLGEPGCFASDRFTAFHRAVMPELLRRRQLHLSSIELDGRPVAAEYQLLGRGVLYAYQSGIDPGSLDHSPGQLSNLVAIRRAIEQGYRAFDFLRGDEPYKAHWRAQPRQSVEIRVVSQAASARLRHRLWLAGSRIKRCIKIARPAMRSKS